MRRRLIELIFLIVVLPVIIYLLIPSDEGMIKKLIKEGAKAIERKDIDSVMSKVSFNYQDDYGFNYLYVKQSMKSIFQRMDNIKVEYESLKITIKDKNATATVDVRIIATIGNETGYILGDMPNPAHLRFTLAKERTKWLVTKTDGLPVF